MEGRDQGPWPVFEELDGAGVAGADEPVGGLEGDAGHLGEAVLSHEVDELLVLVGRGGGSRFPWYRGGRGGRGGG